LSSGLILWGIGATLPVSTAITSVYKIAFQTLGQLMRGNPRK
jgi:hypothetical protein